MVITGINNITAVGHDAKMTAASIRAGIARFVEFNDFYDMEGNPITASIIKGLDDENDDRAERLGNIAEYCLTNMLEEYFADDSEPKREIFLFLGFASESRPGERYEGKNNEIAEKFLNIVKNKTENIALKIIRTGNSSVMHCIKLASEVLKQNPNAICIIGGIDSLLSMETLDWFEDKARLKSESFGRNHAFIPGEAVGFIILESKEKAKPEKVLSEIIGIGLAEEPAPFVSDENCKGEGLTKAVREALTGNLAENISSIFCDLNGEFFPTKEWSYARMRCFEKTDKKRELWHPAEFMGDIGAAFGAVLTGIAVEMLFRGWIKDDAMIFCSDDHGERGALILRRAS